MVCSNDLSKNQILASLPKDESDLLIPRFEPVSVKIGDVLFQAGTRIASVYFPLDAVISSQVLLEEGRSIEVSMTGSEGMLGIEAVLAGKAPANLGIVQIAGHCLKMKTQTFQIEFERSAALRNCLLSYAGSLLSQITQLAACNRVHRLKQRLCRWLLMVHDRARIYEFPMTHEFISHILGVSRSEVTIATGELRKARLIRHVRGKITILDRKRLESSCCECYEAIGKAYEKTQASGERSRLG